MRIDYKGGSDKDERLKLVCQIRHEYTNYEKLTVFYNVYPKRRTELNGVINELIKRGPDWIAEFKKRINKIERYIDLNNKNTQKRFLKEKEQEIKMLYPHFAKSKIKECAKNMLVGYIKKNNRRIIKTKGVKL